MISSPATAWDIAGILGEDLQLTLVEHRPACHPQASGSGGHRVECRDTWARRRPSARRAARRPPLLDGGIADGRVDFRASTDALRFHADMGARGARLGALADNTDDESQLGDPTDVTIRFDGAWRRAEGTIEIPEVHATLAGAPCRARSRCATSTPIRLSISHSACGI